MIVVLELDAQNHAIEKKAFGKRNSKPPTKYPRPGKVPRKIATE